MDRRSWPWKRKSSDKASICADTTKIRSSNSDSSTVDQDNSERVKYVQVSVESYTRQTELEDEVKAVNEIVKDLNEKLSSAQAEITTKENLANQHAKVAEEAVSGWEKAEAEAAALKDQLESVMLMKLTAEEKVSHLDAALKECMKQIRNVKEESEQKLHDVVFAKTKQWEKVTSELESKIGEFEQELSRASAENAAITRSLQERTNCLLKISDEKSQAETKIEVLKANIQAYEKEISSLKYELHVASKEVEIRNEEKKMCVRSAELANKQHVEDAKRITKLEAECQKLRGLVRKKLPGPAAVAQMKLEVESLGWEYGETKIRRLPAKNASPHPLSTAPHGPHPLSTNDVAFEQMQHFQKENEFLAARLLGMEEETKMLKEALSKRNNELQASRSMCAKTANKLRSIEVHMHGMNHQRSPSRLNIDINLEGSVGLNESNLSVTSMSEDGIDDEASCAGSWATALMSELSHFKKDKDSNNKGNTVVTSNRMELMDDFLEMERLACLSAEANATSAAPDGVNNKIVEENSDVSSVVDFQKDGSRALDFVLEPPTNWEGRSASSRCASVSELQSRIASVFEFQANNADIVKMLEDIRHILEDTQCKILHLPEVSADSKVLPMDIVCEQKQSSVGETSDDRCLIQACNASLDCNALDRDLKNAVSQIHDFIVLLVKRALPNQSKSFEVHGLHERMEDFSVTFNKLLNEEISLGRFVLALAQILFIASEINCDTNCNQNDKEESNIFDCVDKVTLLENKVVEHKTSRQTSDREVEGSINSGYELAGTKPSSFSLEEFEQLKLEKENVEVDLAKCTEMLEHTKVKLVETEKKLEGLGLELTASQKSNGLVETQLKCMVESYRLLESRAKDLEGELSLLHAKAETLNNELQEERQSHQEDLTKYKDLELQLERTDKCRRCSTAFENEDIKTTHDKEIAATAEKLAECQETILILGRQLQSLRPPDVGSSPKDGTQLSESVSSETSQSGFNTGKVVANQANQMEMDTAVSSVAQRTSAESPFDGYNTHMSPSEADSNPITGSPISSKRQKHRSSSRSSSSCSSNSLTEKHGRGFSRFFSKGKADN